MNIYYKDDEKVFFNNLKFLRDYCKSKKIIKVNKFILELIFMDNGDTFIYTKLKHPISIRTITKQELIDVYKVRC